MSTAGPTRAPPHARGERFQCRVDVEDICISVEGSVTSSTTALFWEEARVACRFNGITQRTRWIALQPAMDEVKRELQAAAAGDDVDGAAAPQTGGLLALAYTPFNNMSYEVEFTAEEPEDAAAASVTTVKPKRIHLMEFVVEAQNMHRVYSATGGQLGDRAPTSGNMEVISASLNKKAAKVSAWTRSIFSKLGSSDKKEEEAHHHHGQSSKERNEAAMASLSDHTATPNAGGPHAAALGDVTVHEGNYETVAKHIDVSEAYNRPGGRQYYCLVVKPESRKLPGAGVGTPITISFSVVAHYGEKASVPRNYHNYAIVVDQFVLDYSDAARMLPPDPKDNSEQPRPIVGYAFGYTANTSSSPYAMEAASKMVPVVKDGGEEGAIRVVDFDRLHRELDERKRTPEDFLALPTSCCVVSGSTGEKPANKPRLGNRVVCVSRFKTSPDGLCKPSFKCQFTVSLVRFFGDGGNGVREAAAPINLAALLNEEALPQRIRAVKFELGEVMYMRLRRFSFAEPEVLRSPLLMPYDYDNANVQLPTPAPQPQQQQQQQQRAAPAAPTGNTHSDGAVASAATATAGAAAAAVPPGGVPDISFDSSSSSASAAPQPAGQRSGSGSGASTPRVAVQREQTAPLFTLEPQEDTSELQFGSSERTSNAANRATATQGTAGQTYDPLVAAATAWSGHIAAEEHAPAVEVTPSSSNPFFTDYNSNTAARPAETTAYNFGSGNEGQGTANTTAAFELTPFE